MAHIGLPIAIGRDHKLVPLQLGETTVFMLLWNNQAIMTQELICISCAFQIQVHFWFSENSYLSALLF